MPEICQKELDHLMEIKDIAREVDESRPGAVLESEAAHKRALSKLHEAVKPVSLRLTVEEIWRGWWVTEPPESGRVNTSTGSMKNLIALGASKALEGLRKEFVNSGHYISAGETILYKRLCKFEELYKGEMDA